MAEQQPGIFLNVEGDIGFLEFDQPESKVNLLSTEVVGHLKTMLEEVRRNRLIKALVITSRKPGIFIAGADIREIRDITDPAVGEEKSRAGQAVLDEIEDFPIPTIAVIDGVALGGGCELALACRYRLATFNEKIRIGLPEVNLGFVPGFGGTYRLPKLVGLQQALGMILTGRPVDVRKAYRIGLVDKLIPQAAWKAAVTEFVEGLSSDNSPEKKGRRRKRRSFWESVPFLRPVIFHMAKKNVLTRTKGFYPAPLKAIELIAATYGKARPRAMAAESAVFARLAVTEISKNLVHVFYLSERAKKIPFEGEEGTTSRAIQKCGVLGAGVMGGGIAQLLSMKGIRVRLKDIKYEAIGQALHTALSLFKKAARKKKLKTNDIPAKMLAISGTLDYSGFRTTDAVIEAVVENLEIKQAVFREVGTVVGADTLLCSNTSSLPVTLMAEQVNNPQRVVGFHFFNPVHRMPLVEIIKTRYSSPNSLRAAFRFARQLGKTPIIVDDQRGFLVNRILLSYINEAGRLLEEGGSIEEIDRLVETFGMPMGPLLLSDEVGLDVGLKVLGVLEEAFGGLFHAPEIFHKILERGWLGKKSGRGFYVHGEKRRINAKVYSFLSRPRAFPLTEEHRQRMIYLMINEAAKCLQDGVVASAQDVDVGMIFGTGFPPFRGGLLRYADHVGLADITRALERFNHALKTERFTPCGLLKEKAQRNGTFYDG